MDTHARPLEAEDAPAIAAIDRAYARAHGLEPRASEASLRFFARTGHAFVAEGSGRVLGFVLAQPLFDGERAAVFASRLATPPPGDGKAVRALLRALTKSAYDAGIYDIRVELPGSDDAAEALTAESYARVPAALFARYLGSRARTVAARTGGAERTEGEHG